MEGASSTAEGSQQGNAKAVAVINREMVKLASTVSAIRHKVSRTVKSLKGKEVFYVDEVVPAKLRDLLMSNLDAIADQPEKDFQPGTNYQVQNLINPSMFPFIKGLSVVRDPGQCEETRQETSGQTPQSVLQPHVPLGPGQTSDSNSLLWTYQSLPSQFYVDAEGSVKIRSYINNLEKSCNRNLYKAIELLFTIFLPMFEKSLKTTIRSRDLQVIVKAVNYVIEPKARSYHGGWHVEGMKHEHIVASGMYYYSTSQCLKDQGLKFSRPPSSPTTRSSSSPRFRLLHETAEIMRLIRTSTRELLRQVRSSSLQDLPPDELMRFDGVDARRLRYRPADSYSSDEFTIPTKENRLLVFSNNLQHKVCAIANNSPNELGTRKTLMFSLIDPNKQIVSTRDVPEQQWDRIKLQQMAAIREVAQLPEEILSNIMFRAKSGFTLPEANTHRLRFLEERIVSIEDDDLEAML